MTASRSTAGGPGRRDGGITLSSLRTFVTVVESGSLSRAADLLGVSQPSVSIQLNSLEQACGVLLLHRRPAIALTDPGRDLFVRARLVLGPLQEFDLSARELRELKRGRLSIGLSTPSFAMRLLASFLAQHSAVSITTTLGNTGSLLADVSQCRIDVGIMTLIEPEPTLSCRLIARQRLMVCVAHTHPWAKRPEVDLRELAGAPLILREQGSMTRQMVESAFSRQSLKPEPRLELGSREAVKEAAAAGLGVAIHLTGDSGADRRLHSLQIADAGIEAGVYAVCLRESMDIPAVGAFVRHATPPVTAIR